MHSQKEMQKKSVGCKCDWVLPLQVMSMSISRYIMAQVVDLCHPNKIDKCR